MIITTARTISASSLKHFAWTGLSRFKNVKYAFDTIQRYQSPPEKQARNVTKQAEQIRYCIIQAEEYFRASQAVTLATKPLLIYYGIMSLALAELLIKQNGTSSLDAARQVHNHHGLTLKLSGSPYSFPDLRDSAATLSATPLIKGDNSRFGTFDLWHRTSRETPFVGTHTIEYGGAGVSSIGVVASGDDVRPRLLPPRGLTLLDCLQSIPDMRGALSLNNVASHLVRGRMETVVDHVEKVVRHITHIQPTEPVIRERVYNKFRYPPSVIDTLSVTEVGAHACAISMTMPFENGSHSSDAPFGYQVNEDEVLFSSEMESLNEFGLYYVASYILGNYARYYPDFWMKDVESSSSLALVAAEFLSHCEDRVPLLALSELSQVYHVVK